MVGQSILIPLVDAFLKELHRLPPGTDVEYHEEDQWEAYHHWNTDTDLVEELIVTIWVSFFNFSRIGIDDVLNAEPYVALHIFLEKKL